MGFFAKLRPSRSESGPPEVNGNNGGNEVEDEKKDPVEAPNTELVTDDGESISSGNDGVKKAQATTIVWTRGALIVAYGM